MKNLEEILNEKILSSNSIGGGCIADAKKIITESGNTYFVKSYYDNNASILINEANGLRELKKTGVIKIPDVVFCNNEFLIIEYIKSGKRKNNFSELFGRQFAEMHKFSSENFGFYENNYIGANRQINIPQKENWIDFYWEHRLLYQFKLAERNGYVDSSFQKSFAEFEKRVPDILKGSEEKPSILHGDLWSGNYIVDENGDPVLIDPAVYYGHREADLGMTKLFGGFDSDFYSSYNETFPLREGWEYRIDIYKLYHVMNHLNLFGTGYLSQAKSIINNYK
ncbi:MAG: fructosamine kinase family protein [Bacteroidetes bacterium]|nr:fructosamine kinase family protein [Bacteroidota bacterium]